ncbi:MAG: extracellular solute-binding protein [Chloroflexi bacterium]|nr:extracellular solute-binding protein [Chloroflexota bacterium]
MKSNMMAFLTIVFLVLFACGKTVLSPESEGISPTKSIAKPVESGKPGWEQQWNEVLDEARKEGKVVLISAVASEARVEIDKAFRDKTGLTLEWIIGRTAETTQKVQAERRAGLYLVDMYYGSNNSPIDRFKPEGWLVPLSSKLMLPEVTDPGAWYGGKLPFLDSDQFAVTTTLSPKSPVLINTDMVRPEEFKTFKDLLNPKWKGKMVMNDPLVGGGGLELFQVMFAITGSDNMMRELAKQEPVLVRDLRLMVEWVAKGKYPVLVAPQAGSVSDFMRAGAPIAYQSLDDSMYLTGTMGTLTIFDRTPHPKAAQVFLNWFLSKEGQTLNSRLNLTQSARLDTDTSFLSPDAKMQPNVKYFNTSNEDFLLGRAKMEKLAKDIFGPLVK